MVCLAFLQNLGPTELVIILAVLLLLFGATKIPKLARSLGRSTSEFKKGLREDGSSDEDEDETKDTSDEDKA